MPSDYREELAWIHHAGFSEFAESAAAGVLEILWRSSIRDGMVVDVGCGSGILARELTGAGFQVLGIDASPAMIEIARRTAPAATFEVASFEHAELPACDAIVAMGEVLNYGSLAAVRSFVSNASRAIRPAGILLFDVAERTSHPVREERRIGGDDWSVITISESDGNILTRRILTFRQAGDEIRRDGEVHTLHLHDRSELVQLLRDAGFRTRVRRSYGTRRLPKGHAVYVAIR